MRRAVGVDRGSGWRSCAARLTPAPGRRTGFRRIIVAGVAPRQGGAARRAVPACGRQVPAVPPGRPSLVPPRPLQGRSVPPSLPLGPVLPSLRDACGGLSGPGDPGTPTASPNGPLGSARRQGGTMPPTRTVHGLHGTRVHQVEAPNGAVIQVFATRNGTVEVHGPCVDLHLAGVHAFVAALQDSAV